MASHFQSRLLSLALLFAAAGAVPAAAAVMPRFSLEDLVARSEIIAQAHAGASWSAWDVHHKYIWTHYQMQVVDAIRGSAQIVVVSEPGGTVDGVSQGFSDMMSWKPGEDVVLFLHHVPNGYLRVTGGSQGNARISSDGSVVLSHLSRMPLSDFKARMRAVAKDIPVTRSAQ